MLAVRILALRSGGICKWVHLIDGDQGDGMQKAKHTVMRVVVIVMMMPGMLALNRMT